MTRTVAEQHDEADGVEESERRTERERARPAELAEARPADELSGEAPAGWATAVALHHHGPAPEHRREAEHQRETGGRHGGDGPQPGERDGGDRRGAERRDGGETTFRLRGRQRGQRADAGDGRRHARPPRDEIGYTARNASERRADQRQDREAAHQRVARQAATRGGERRADPDGRAQLTKSHHAAR